MAEHEFAFHSSEMLRSPLLNGPRGIIRDKGQTRLQGPAAINGVNGTQGLQELKGPRPAGLGFIKCDAHLADLPNQEGLGYA
jgi:hypothetical protein